MLRAVNLLPQSLVPSFGGSIVPETCAVPEGRCRLRKAGLDSHDRSPPGAIVPVAKSDFGCCGLLFGGEIALWKEADLDPAGKPVS